ncbi:MAG: hypothetical protein ABH857_02020 [Elusimicrobiota bacterium]
MKKLSNIISNMNRAKIAGTAVLFAFCIQVTAQAYVGAVGVPTNSLINSDAVKSVLSSAAVRPRIKRVFDASFALICSAGNVSIVTFRSVKFQKIASSETKIKHNNDFGTEFENTSKPNDYIIAVSMYEYLIKYLKKICGHKQNISNGVFNKNFGHNKLDGIWRDRSGFSSLFGVWKADILFMALSVFYYLTKIRSMLKRVDESRSEKEDIENITNMDGSKNAFGSFKKDLNAFFYYKSNRESRGQVSTFHKNVECGDLTPINLLGGGTHEVLGLS